MKTGPDDVKVSSEDGEIRGSSSGDPASSVINDAADVDGTHCTLEEGAVECTTEETDVGGVGGEGGGGGGDGPGGGGSGGGDPGDPSGSDGASSPASELGIAFAGWAASAAERATELACIHSDTSSTGASSPHCARTASPAMRYTRVVSGERKREKSTSVSTLRDRGSQRTSASSKT